MIHHGDCLEVLKTLPEASVHCVVTSPPYWSLRDYGVPPTIWGGAAGCDHQWRTAGSLEGYTAKKKWQHQINGQGEEQYDGAVTRKSHPDGWTLIEQGKFCTRCAAWLGCLGLEPTPDLYIEHLALVFDEVWRVLRPDGTCWLNLGDCYAAARGSETAEASRPNQSAKSGHRIGTRSSFRRDRSARGDVAHKQAPGLKPKDLVGAPWMAAFALRARGWYLRSDIIWAKSNPMPESTRDRPTKSHEYLFLLTKSERYYYDADAIREALEPDSQASGNKARKYREDHGGPAGKYRRQAHAIPWQPTTGGRNRRSVWRLPTAPFPGAHFATFPPRLVEPCILAGTSEHGCCSLCGAPFRRIVELGAPLEAQRAIAGADSQGEYHGKARKAYDGTGAQDPSAVKARILEGMRERVTVGWRPTCRHALREVEPCIVLDPFAGSGTTGLVAARHGRAFVGIELNESYVAIAGDRAKQAERSRVADAEASA